MLLNRGNLFQRSKCLIKQNEMDSIYIQVTALYDFVTEVAGELCFSVDDVLILTNQNVGEGWWEAKNCYGQVGLVPQSYFQVIGDKRQIHLSSASLPPRVQPPLPLANGEPLSLRPVIQVSCQVHQPFNASSVEEHQKPVSKSLLPGGRPVLPIKPPSLNVQALATQTVVDDKDNAVDNDAVDEERVESSKDAAPLIFGRPVPPVKPPGLFARMSGLAVGVACDVIQLVCDNDDQEGEVDWDEEGGDFDCEKVDEWDEDCDEDDEDFYEEENAAVNDSEEDSVEKVLDTAHEDGGEEGAEEAHLRDDVSSDDGPRQQPAADSTPKKQISRISHFTMGGGDTYLFDMKLPGVPDTVLRTFVSETSDSNPCWVTRLEPYTCSILSPRKATKFRGMKSFIVYQITSSFCVGHVSRRYKQFNWLHQRLVDKFSTIAVPPLPEKQISGRFEDQFINARLRQLQLWIDRMCRHPVIAQSDVYIHFLTCTNAKMWKAGKRISEKDKYRGGLFFQTVVAPSKPLDARYVERKMDNFGRFIRSLEDSIRHLYGVGEMNAKMHHDVFGKEYQKLGKSIVSLAKAFEHDERTAAYPLTNAVANTGRAVDDVGKLFSRQPQNDLYRLMEGLSEYRGLLTVLPDILLVHRSSTNKIQENAGMMTEAEIEAVESRADVITYTVLAEMNHFQEHRVIDFRNYMQTYLQQQIAFYRQITTRLQEALQQFECV